jgi:hypothetical protein
LTIISIIIKLRILSGVLKNITYKNLGGYENVLQKDIGNEKLDIIILQARLYYRLN